VRRIDELATKCCGQILAASVLGASIKGVDNIDQAAMDAEENQAEARRFLKGDHYFKWICEDLASIKESLARIDFRKIEQFDKAKQRTFNLFEAHLISICEKIEDNTSGISNCITEIFSSEGLEPKLPHTVLQILVEISQSTAVIKRISRLMLRPLLYRLTDPRLIATLLFACLLSIPLWYIWKVQNQLAVGDPHDLISAVAQQARSDAERLHVETSASNHIVGQLWISIVFLWDSLLKLPAIFAGLAIVLQLIRVSLRLNEKTHRQLTEYEDVFRKLAADFGVTKGPVFTMKTYNISGGRVGAVGDGSAADNFTQGPENPRR
jgi:hypothetical protein